MNYIAPLIIFAIIICLGSAFIGLLRGGSKGSDQLFKSLAIRVGLSVFLFLLLLLAGALGWVEPNYTALPTQ